MNIYRWSVVTCQAPLLIDLWFVEKFRPRSTTRSRILSDSFQADLIQRLSPVENWWSGSDQTSTSKNKPDIFLSSDLRGHIIRNLFGPIVDILSDYVKYDDIWASLSLQTRRSESHERTTRGVTFRLISFISHSIKYIEIIKSLKGFFPNALSSKVMIVLLNF